MKPTTLLVLFTAAILEAGGDAFVRSGLRTSAPSIKTLLFVAGGLVLFSYGWVVNTAPWDFGQLIGIYISFFFVVAQIISWLVFAQPPALAVLIGGAFVIVGGIIMSFA